MTSSEHRRGGYFTLLLLSATACASGDVVGNGFAAPENLKAGAISSNAIQVTWDAASGTDLINYEVQRRQSFTGRFTVVTTLQPNTGTTFFDTGLEPSTFYGYRVVAVDRLGNRSAPSTVAGALTAPAPGIRIVTGLGSNTTNALADPDGYQLHITGPVDTTRAIGPIDDRVFAPLPAGDYTITLSKVLSTCTIAGDTVRTVTVTDLGLETERRVEFIATCADPTRGEIVARVTVAGDSLDADGYQVDLAGIIPGDSVPVLSNGFIPGEGGSADFGLLKPGDYEISLADVESPCTVTGPAQVEVMVQAQTADTVQFNVSCPTKGGGSGPLVWRNSWTPQAAPNGQTATLDIALDLTAVTGQSIGSVQAIVLYDPAVLTFVSATAPAPTLLGNLTTNTSTPGRIRWINFATGTPPTGNVPAARFTFHVVGAQGSNTDTRTTIQIATAGDGTIAIDTLFRVVEDTFSVGAAGGGNQAPTAQAGGPYSGTAGTAISFSSAGSSDPDGSIASYSWAFGDGGTSTVANPTHSYAAAGSYTARLTVTDNQGAQGTGQATVTVTGAGGGNQSPVAVAGGPYNGVAGSAISFSSAGSVDPDGTIAGYDWDFGDGGSSTQVNPSHSYAAAGSYTATLTVTDNLGATGTAQAQVTVTAANTTPFAWTSSFGGFEQALGTYPLSITLNLTSDIPETTGPEALGSFAVDSLVWDPAVLEYHSLAFGSGGGSFNTTNATGGCRCKLVFSGNPTSNTGIVTVATVRFRPVGAAGSSTTTKTSLGPVLSTAALGSFNYRTRIQPVEGMITLP
jgi:PKD repeat protein